MARLKKSNSESLTKARSRASAMASIDPALDLGSGMTLVAYQAAIQAAENKQSEYNTKLSEVDELLNDFLEAERAVDDLSERMLTGVATKFGKNSNEYEKAGGKRKSERKRPKAKAPQA